MNKNFFVKAHGLGNEYIILDEDNITFDLTKKAIEKICNVNFGIGSDGILLKTSSKSAEVGLRIFNPDGSEAEKSGNGLRIFCKYIFDYKLVKDRNFKVETKGGIINAYILKTEDGRASVISIDIGKAVFNASEIPTSFESEEVINEKIEIDNKEYEINCVSIGNPHCVILKNKLDEEEIKKVGPKIEHYRMFPNRINVQFAKVNSRKEAEILIWERGAGFTLASGTSSCAAASVLKKKGLIDSEVKIKMPGGNLDIVIDENWNIKLTGEIREICNGILSSELIEDIRR